MLGGVLGGGMRNGLILLLAMGASPALAQDWHPLTGPEIIRVLERHHLRYPDGSEQVFNYGGLTEFRIGWPNEGRWRVREGRYCSVWPPQTDWQCYAVAAQANGIDLRFMDDDGQTMYAEILKE
jgi:hypothetical protein